MLIRFENLKEMLSTLKSEAAGYMAVLCTVFSKVTTTMTVSFYIVTREVYFHCHYQMQILS
jgi:uncharacterized membrane protein YkgB